MARVPRRHLVENGSVNHCTWRSHNFEHVLATDEAKAFFLELLATHKDEHGIEIHSYAIMNTHPHVQLRSKHGQTAFSRFWRVVNYRFARWSNRRDGKRGQVVMDRLTSPQVQDGQHQVAVMRYGDLNPVRAGLVKSPKDWRWSSYRHYAFGEKNDLITDAPEYLALGRSDAERQRAYIHLFSARPSAALRQRRWDLVSLPFIGQSDWARSKLQLHGLSPPRANATPFESEA